MGTNQSAELEKERELEQKLRGIRKCMQESKAREDERHETKLRQAIEQRKEAEKQERQLQEKQAKQLQEIQAKYLEAALKTQQREEDLRKQLAALKTQQREEDLRKQLELEKKLRECLAESRVRENRIQEEKRMQAIEQKKEKEKLTKQLEDIKLQKQKEKDAEEERRKYLEPLKIPWRTISPKWDDPWKREFKDELLLKINTITPAGGINYFNILLLGQAAAGKSSFFNTCYTALMDDDRLMGNNQVYQGASKSVSTSVEAIPMKTKDGNVLPIRLFDCRGLNRVHGVPTEDIRLIIKGHVKSGYNINPVTPITEDNEKYRKDPEKKDCMHCIVYVANAGNPSEQLTDEETEKQLRHVRETIALQHLPQLVLFTNIDKIRISNTNNLGDIFRSRGVKDTCDKAAEFMQIPLMNVLPMSNYHEENMPTLEKDILALFYLLTMMQRAKDYVIRITKTDAPEDFYD